MTSKHAEDAVPFINMTPLIDVLLVLLIIFMVASPLKLAQFKTRIPEPLDPKDLRITPRDLNLRVDLAGDETIKINGTEAGSLGDLSRLTGIIVETLKLRTELGTVDPSTGLVAKAVFVKAPRSIRYGSVAKLIDGIKGSGASPIGLQIDELDER